MRTEAALTTPTNQVGSEWTPPGKVSALVCALICPPALTLLLGVLMGDWLETEPGNSSRANISQVLMPLMLGGTILLAAFISLDCWASEKLDSAAGEFRTALSLSTIVALTFLTVWATAQAERNHVSYAGELVVFMCLPLLLVCAPLLWFSAKAVQSALQRTLMLAVFTGATALVELQCYNQDYGNAEEQVFMVHSLLIALALALRLGTWWWRGSSWPVRETGA